MKKILILALCLVAVSMTGCKKNEGKKQNLPTPTPPVIIENGAIGVTTENGKVRINMPKEAFGENVVEVAEKVKTSRGFELAEVQEDQSVTFVMTSDQHQKWLADTKENVEETAENVTKKFRSLDDVEFNYDLTEAVVEADESMFDAEREKVASTGIANAAFVYQSMNGVKKENLKIVVKFVDDKTDKLLETVEVSGNK